MQLRITSYNVCYTKLLRKSVAKVFSNKEFIVDASNKDFFIARTELSKDKMLELFNRLGGFIKYGEIVDLDDPSVIEGLVKLSPKKYGVSVYGNWENGKDREYAASYNFV